MLAAFLTILAGMSAVMIAAWATQRAVRNTGWVDVFWTFGTGLSCAAAALWPAASASTARQWMVAALAIAWSVRLGGYVALRVAAGEEDARYARLRTEWGKAYQRRLFSLVIVQAPATALIALSVFAAAHLGGASLGPRDLIGASLLVIAIAGEALADEQMRRFKADPAHARIMDRGLWGWSRHPNYFFEWLGWLAYPAIAFAPGQSASYATLIAPVLMFLILRYGTGVPALEKNMRLSRGAAFDAYRNRVSAFFPWPPRRRLP